MTPLFAHYRKHSTHETLHNPKQIQPGSKYRSSHVNREKCLNYDSLQLMKDASTIILEVPKDLHKDARPLLQESTISTWLIKWAELSSAQKRYSSHRHPHAKPCQWYHNRQPHQAFKYYGRQISSIIFSRDWAVCLEFKLTSYSFTFRTSLRAMSISVTWI